MRTALFVIGVLLLAASLFAALAGGPIILVIWLGILGLVLAAGVAFERGRYKAAGDGRAGPDWQATGERFVDPTSGETVAVFYRPATGERRYVST